MTAKPKSHSLTRVHAPSTYSTFSGLTSRWHAPAACKWRSADATWPITVAATRSASPLHDDFCSWRRSEPPAQYSSATCVVFSASSTSITLAIAGWALGCSRLRTWSSLRMLAAAALSFASILTRWNVLIATSCAVSVRSARTTIEKAPDAIGLSSSYPCAASTGLEPRRDVAAPLLYAALACSSPRLGAEARRALCFGAYAACSATCPVCRLGLRGVWIRGAARSVDASTGSEPRRRVRVSAPPHDGFGGEVGRGHSFGGRVEAIVGSIF